MNETIHSIFISCLVIVIAILLVLSLISIIGAVLLVFVTQPGAI